MPLIKGLSEMKLGSQMVHGVSTVGQHDGVCCHLHRALDSEVTASWLCDFWNVALLSLAGACFSSKGVG